MLTHEALVDAVWETSIQPALLARYPQVTPEQLKQAHAFCYGGSIIQDIGYYPFGSHEFSDLTHYVRSGDFVLSLLEQAGDVNEYAFAIGALAHYNADNEGHMLAINRTVPELYPKLRRKHGASVTYSDDPTAHIRTEFAFDVVQVARGLYPSEAYHNFIGFEVAKPVLDRACLQTYGLRLSDIFRAFDLALSTYRFSVKDLIPEMTKAAWAAKKGAIQKNDPKMDRHRFLYQLSRSSYEKEWGRERQRPSFFARLLAFFVRILPKVGPFKALGFRIPPPDAELQFEKSFEATVDVDKRDLGALMAGKLTLVNRNLDTGAPARQGEYALADSTYSALFEKLTARKREAPRGLRSDYERFQHASAAK